MALAAVLWASAARLADAQLSPPARPELRVGSLDNGIRLDGRLDEPEWVKADSIADLTQIEPVEGGKPAMRTVVKVLADRHQLVFGIVAHDPDPSGIVAFAVRRDAHLRGEDNLRIVLDPFLDGRSGVVFTVNANGARYDALVSRRGAGENPDWDQVWDAKAVRTGSGWSVEIWIPVRSLTFKPGLRRWGFNIERRVQRLQETDRWASPRRDYNFDQTSRAGLLTGLPAFSLGLGLSVRPFVAGGGGKPAPGASVDTNEEQGADITQRIGTNLEATLTINTDFGETEVDARQTNLTRFPLFFPEKRTFFLQGSDIFDFGLGLRRDLIPFFTRRIGLLEGKEVNLDAGGKVNGRIGNTNVGGLLVRTGDVSGLTPSNTLGVVRVKQNVLAESSAGFIATFGDPRGRDGSWLVGPDFTYQTSHFRGDKNFLVGAWGLAMGREGLTGGKSAFGLRLDYPNELWDISLTFKHLGDGFDPSLGFVPRPGTNQLNWGVRYSPRPAWSLVRQMFYELEGSVVTRVDGSLQSWRVFTAPLNWRLESGDGFEFNIIPQGEGLVEPFEVADGVTIAPGRYDFLRYRLEGRFASKRRLSGQVTWRFGDFFTGTLHQLEISSFWTPVRLFTLELSTETDIGRLPEGNFTENLFQGRIRMNFSPDLELSSFIQYDNTSDILGSNTRLRWTFRPVGDLFVVYNQSVRDTGTGGLGFDSNQLIIKITYEVRF
ncbi:MAG: DUF5916 domain-containing protein [Gemmatimonadota bacterium]